ncbi:MAG: flagellar basal-body rod protein FlgF [Acetobacteraceae bacterium]|nr:flagellar basal-body rod protein FlgF [Acetobacteraceae bacterium]
MDNAGYIILSRMAAQLRATAVIAHNLANADTPGFHASRPVFAVHLSAARAAALPPGARDLHFSWDRATWRDTDPGPLRQTGNPLDVAIAGEGYFVVETPRGERYTRAGRFTLSADGTIVDMGGNPVLSDAGRPIEIAPGDTDLTIGADGTLTGRNGEIGRLRVVRFEDPQALLAEGDRLFAAPPGADPRPLDRPRLVQGALEASNVNPVLEMVRMTEDLRQFQFAVRMAEAENERIGGTVDRLLRRR